jgi:hypothetical protein
VLKLCYVCKEHKELSEFYNSSKSKDGKRFECKVCSNAASTAYAKKHWQEKIQPKSRGYRLKHRYGLAQEDFDALYKEQGGGCAICRVALEQNGNGFSGGANVDHCHSTGKIRGLLCGLCNSGLGKFKDDTDNLAAAIVYLERYKNGDDLEATR